MGEFLPWAQYFNFFSPHRTSAHLPLTTLGPVFQNHYCCHVFSFLCAGCHNNFSSSGRVYTSPSNGIPYPTNHFSHSTRLVSLVGHKIVICIPTPMTFSSFSLAWNVSPPSVYPAFRFFPFKAFPNDVNSLTVPPEYNTLGSIRKLNAWLHQIWCYSPIISGVPVQMAPL